MKLRAPKKVKQQRRVTLLAVYLLKRLGIPRPQKRQVLRFISTNGLMHIPNGDFGLRSTGEDVWKNDLAWKRQDLVDDGLLRMPERGVWEITPHGERDVEEWAERTKRITELNPNWAAVLTDHESPSADSDDDIHSEYYITRETVEWALKIANKAPYRTSL